MHHRLRSRHGEGQALETAIRDWRAALASPRDEVAAARAELADVLQDLGSIGVERIRHLADRATDFCDTLDQASNLRWALREAAPKSSMERACEGMECALEELERYRPALDRLADLDNLADELDNLPKAVAEVIRSCDAIAQADDEDNEDLGVESPD
jgi:hypothetical protein